MNIFRKTCHAFFSSAVSLVTLGMSTGPLAAQTWQDISANVPGTMSQEQFANMASDGTRLYLLGNQGVFVSSDDGNSFTAINAVSGGGPDLSQHTQRFIKYVNGEIWVGGAGFVGSGLPAAPRLHRLTPGQTVWQPSAGGLPGAFGEGSEDDLTHDPVSGNYFGTLSTGTVYVSTDGGNNWQPRINGLGGSPSSIVPVSGAVLTSRPLAGVLKTTDQGLNWSGVQSFGASSIGNMIARNGRVLIVAERTLHFSDNAGDSWKQVPNIPHGNSVLSGDGGNVYAVSRNNTVPEALAYSASCGLTWHTLTRDGLPPIPVFAGYYVLNLLRHGDFLFLRGKTLNNSFLLESTQLHRLDVSAFNFLNDFQIVIQPQGRGLLVGQSHELEVYAAGENLTYQWRRNGVDLPGKTGRTLPLPDVTPADSGDYTVLVKSGVAPAVPSAVATVTVFTREDGRWDPVFDQTDINVGGRVHPLPDNEAIVVRTDTTSQTIYRIGADGRRLQNASTTTTSGNNLSNSLVDQDGRIVLAIKPSSNASAVRRYNASSFVLESSLFFDTGTAVRVRDLVEVPGVGYAAAGQFSTAGGLSRTNFAVIGYDNVVNSTFNTGSGPNSTVDSLTVSSSGDIYAAGAFNSWGGVSTPRGIARLASNGVVHAVDTGITGLAVGDSAKLIHALADGRFLLWFGPTTKTLYALNANGTHDASFNTAGHTIADIKRVAQQADGKIIIVGGFTSFGGVTAAGYVRLNTNGTVDESFHTATGFSSGTINDVTYDPRGYIYLSTANTGGSSNATFQGQGPVGRGPVRIFATAAGSGGGTFANWPALASVPEDQRGPLATPADDGVSNLVKFAVGVNPLDSATGRIPHEVIEGSGNDEGYPVVSFTRVKNQTGVTIRVQVATSPGFADDLGSTVIDIEDLGDGTERVSVRSNARFSDHVRQFFRLGVTLE